MSEYPPVGRNQRLPQPQHMEVWTGGSMYNTHIAPRSLGLTSCHSSTLLNWITHLKPGSSRSVDVCFALRAGS